MVQYRCSELRRVIAPSPAMGSSAADARAAHITKSRTVWNAQSCVKRTFLANLTNVRQQVKDRTIRVAALALKLSPMWVLGPVTVAHMTCHAHMGLSAILITARLDPARHAQIALTATPADCPTRVQMTVPMPVAIQRQSSAPRNSVPPNAR